MTDIEGISDIVRDFIPAAKRCKYGCGTLVYWDDKVEGKLKWKEADGVTIHGYKRCADLLKSQGKELIK